MSKEQAAQLFGWLYKGIVTICLIVVWAIVQNTYAAFSQTRESMIRLEVLFNQFKENTEKQLDQVRSDVKEIKANETKARR